MSQRLLDALRGMVGLVQLVQTRYPDFPVDNHRVIEAMSAMNEAERTLSESKEPIATARRIVQLEKALQQCVNVAKSWHGEDAFDLYYNHSPEMKLIRDAIGKMPEEA